MNRIEKRSYLIGIICQSIKKSYDLDLIKDYELASVILSVFKDKGIKLSIPKNKS